MTVEEILERVEQIKHIPSDGLGDDEFQHAAEDALWEAVLRAIAEGDGIEAVELRALAKAALTTTDLTFCRWYG